jgi:hypothetical protein
MQLEEGEERGTCLVFDILSHLVFSHGIVLEIYVKEFFVGFSPQ